MNENGFCKSYEILDQNFNNLGNFTTNLLPDFERLRADPRERDLKFWVIKNTEI